MSQSALFAPFHCINSRVKLPTAPDFSFNIRLLGVHLSISDCTHAMDPNAENQQLIHYQTAKYFIAQVRASRL
jgi:hypothetical protein